MATIHPVVMNPLAMANAMVVIIGKCLGDAAKTGSHGDQRQKSLLHDESFGCEVRQGTDASKAALRMAETAGRLMRDSPHKALSLRSDEMVGGLPAKLATL